MHQFVPSRNTKPRVARKQVIQHCYRDFLIESYVPDEHAYPDPVDQLREVLIHENYLSQKDIEFCLDVDIDSVATRPEHNPIRELHNALRAKYGSAYVQGAA